ncbi:MAG: ribose 5-phosphate isomerase B [Deltaproteobacteria bacterium]|nr:ribose 5-phosphate isomerase B [Deltaproteobacteria bacterium]
MKLFIAADHAGFELKQRIIEKFHKKVQIEDLGTQSTESCDYPIYAQKLCERLLSEESTFVGSASAKPTVLGLLICGTGIGMSIAANKIKGIRAAAVSDVVSARMAREHNNCQVLCLGARILEIGRSSECLQAFLDAKFDTANPRHQRRIDEIAELEK